MATIDELYLTDILHKKDMQVTPQGDIALISGKDNVVDAIIRRIITTKGSIVHRPNYGVGLKRLQNAINSVQKQLELAEDIRVQLADEERVETVKEISVSVDDNNPERLRVFVRADLVGFGEVTISEVFDGS